MSYLQSVIDDKLTYATTSGEDIVYLCPKCNDKSGHLYVNYNKGLFHCFRCEFKGRSIEYLARCLGIPVSRELEELHDQPLYYEMLGNVIDSLSNKRITFKSKPMKNNITNYYIEQSKPLSLRARGYLNNRGLSDREISFYRMREGVDARAKNISIKGGQVAGKDYSGRILVPSRDAQGNISYFVARDYTSYKNIKYLNPPKEVARAQEDLWNADLVQGECVIICEGVFTAIAINSLFNRSIAIATYGKSISTPSQWIETNKSQLEQLIAMKKQRYIIFYDKDAKRESYELSKLLNSYNLNTWSIKIPEYLGGAHADAADLTKRELLEMFHYPNLRKFNQLDLILN